MSSGTRSLSGSNPISLNPSPFNPSNTQVIDGFNAQGVPTGWFLFATNQFTNIPTTSLGSSKNDFSVGTRDGSVGLVRQGPSITATGQNFVRNNPGTWSVASLGQTPINPVLPGGGGCVGNNCSPFNFPSVPRPVGGATRFFDPLVATGYNFESQDANTLFTSVVVPNDYGDGLFNLLLPDQNTGQFVDSGTVLNSNTTLDFASLGFANGLSKFSLRGIETSANVDPSDPQGFVVGLSFADVGNNSPVNFNMTPLTADTSAVPVPAAVWLLSSALGGLGFARRRIPI